MTTATTESPPASGRDRPLMIGAIVIGVVAVLAIVVVFIGGSTVTLDPGSPEGVVQRFTQALIDGDRATAGSLTTDSRDCELGDDLYITDGDIRVTLGDVRITGDAATVDVTVTRSSGDPLIDPYQSSDRARFELTKVDGEWRIDNSPWPFWTYCIERP